MKINQLFNKAITEDLVQRVLQCFGLSGFGDRRMFCKFDLENQKTVERMNAIVPELRHYYMPCKAKTYLVDMTVKKCVTVLKQVIRLYGLSLISKEKNVQGRKVIFYQMLGSGDYDKMRHMTNRPGSVTVNFT
jgi:hypothetical protein